MKHQNYKEIKIKEEKAKRRKTKRIWQEVDIQKKEWDVKENHIYKKLLCPLF